MRVKHFSTPPSEKEKKPTNSAITKCDMQNHLPPPPVRVAHFQQSLTKVEEKERKKEKNKERKKKKLYVNSYNSFCLNSLNELALMVLYI